MLSRFREALDVFMNGPVGNPDDVDSYAARKAADKLSKADEIKVYMSCIVSRLPTGQQVYDTDGIESLVETLIALVYLGTKDPTARAAVSVMGFDLLSTYRTSQALTTALKDAMEYSSDHNAAICSYLTNKMHVELVEREQINIKGAQTSIYKIVEGLVKGE